MIARNLGGWLSFFGLLVAGAALAGAPATVPQIYVKYALPGDAARSGPDTIVIDKGLKLTRDAAGLLHLGVDLPLVGLLASGCSVDAAGVLTCPKVTFGAPGAQ